MKKLFVLFALALVLLVACGEGETAVPTTFIGGEKGVTLRFDNLIPQVFGDEAFNVGVALTNEGETLVKREDVRVRLSGLRGEDFNKRESELVLNPDDDLIQRTLGSDGVIIEGPTIPLEFVDLKYLNDIAGSEWRQALIAEVCYPYETRAVANLCSRRNLLNPAAGGICEIVGPKAVANSGGPLQVVDVSESTRGSNKIGFTFRVVHRGTGVVTSDPLCEITRQENKFEIAVDTRAAGLTCTGLSERDGTAVKGEATLREGSKEFSCTQEVPARDFEAPVVITVNYNYFDTVRSEIVVKKVEQ